MKDTGHLLHIFRKGEHFTLETATRQDGLGYIGSLSPNFIAWQQEALHLLGEGFGSDSHIYARFKKGSDTSLLGYSRTEFDYAMSTMMSALGSAVETLSLATTPCTRESLDAQLVKILPSDLHSFSLPLANLLSVLIANPSRSPLIDLSTYFQPQTLQQLLQALSTRQVTSPETVISFGSENSVGDVVIRDVAGGNITTVNLFLVLQSGIK
jgi:hypothetical protein